MKTRVDHQLIVGPMLAIVALAGCVSQGKYKALQTENEQLQQKVSAQSAEIAAGRTQISRLQGAIRYTVNSDLLFPSGGWEMNEAGKQVIAKFAAKLAPTQQNRLIVNGYTDNAPVGPMLMKKGVISNQELSQKRAESVMEFLISQGVKKDHVFAVGYGDSEPIAPNTTPQGRAQNRRVELTLGGSAN